MVRQAAAVQVGASRLLLIALRFTHCHLLDLKSLAVPSTFVLGVVGSFLTSARFLESCDVFGQPQLQISPPGSLRSFSGIQ